MYALPQFINTNSKRKTGIIGVFNALPIVKVKIYANKRPNKNPAVPPPPPDTAVNYFVNSTYILVPLYRSNTVFLRTGMQS